MQSEIHTHRYNGVTTYDSGHVHEYSGETSADPDYQGHVHYMTGVTTYDDGHNHSYRIQTGPAIYFNGGHYHYFRGSVDFANVPVMHTHM